MLLVIRSVEIKVCTILQIHRSQPMNFSVDTIKFQISEISYLGHSINVEGSHLKQDNVRTAQTLISLPGRCSYF